MMMTLAEVRASRIRRFWPNLQEVAEISNDVLEEAPRFCIAALRAETDHRCWDLAEQRAASALIEEHYAEWLSTESSQAPWEYT